MPNKDPDLAKQRKHEWYVKKKDEILKWNRERRAAKKKQKPPRPKPPPPSPEKVARTRELSWQACNRYRDTHLAQVRLMNRIYYHKNRKKIVQQQRNKRAAKKSVPEIESFGRRVFRAVERAKPWTRPRKETKKRMWNINGNIEKERKRLWTEWRKWELATDNGIMRGAIVSKPAGNTKHPKSSRQLKENNGTKTCQWNNSRKWKEKTLFYKRHGGNEWSDRGHMKSTGDDSMRDGENN